MKSIRQINIQENIVAYSKNQTKLSRRNIKYLNFKQDGKCGIRTLLTIKILLTSLKKTCEAGRIILKWFLEIVCESVNGNRLTQDGFTKGYPYNINQLDALFTFNLFQ
jgi:hypothetical protein